MEPPEPVVAVALGGSRQLICRLACPGRGTASVQWRGLDTSLGAVQSDAGSSVLWVRNASLSTGGTRVCVGSCGNHTLQQTVQLLVFGETRAFCRPAALLSLYRLFWGAFLIAHPAPAPNLHLGSS